MKLRKLLNIGLLSIAPIFCLTSITACGPKGEEDDPTKCKLTLDADGGVFDEQSSTTTYTISKLNYYGQVKDSLPKPTRTLYKFKGYALSKSVETLADSYQFTDTSKTLYAVWEQLETVTIKFDANGGVFEHSETEVTKQLLSGTLLKDVQLNNPTKTNCVFNGWTIDSQVVLNENYALEANTTLKANWLDESTKFTVTVDENLDANETTSLQVPSGTIIGSLGSSFTRTGYKFRCFCDSNSEQISKNYIVNSDFSCKVWWKAESETETAEEYIYNRTFSIISDNDNGIGTCWILADATPNDSSDFKYWIATNLHVRVGVEESATQYKFTDTKDKITYGEGFTDFVSFQWEDKSKFVYDATKPSDAIDLSIAKADFSDATGTTLTKLQNLNSRQQNQGCITEFVDSVSSSKHYESLSNISTGGFGSLTSGYQWEIHSDLDLDFIYYSAAGHYTQDPTYSYDVSPQYKLKQEVAYMRPGASGSMLIGKDTDNTWKVLGIYWGGTSSSQSSETINLCFSCFNSDKKNFIDDYCTYHLNY